MSNTTHSWAWISRDSPIGPLLLAATEAGLLRVVFHADAETRTRAVAQLRTRFGAGGAGESPEASAWVEEAARQLDSYFEGALKAFTVPLDWSLTGGFHERVLRELATGVRFGATVGYQDLADRVGEPGAARAVGVAMGANPLPVVVPCHRVVESGGGIGGFGGGLETKRALLTLEGLLPEPLF
ncbi:methylated-DNA--[protein]-cysteine S-methyltransferase [Streptomyces sp. N2-109]|uniref:Methylated-DNA--protein-cysteine methyltransferase n=1 Tax=Streptomyces gossypii TaxID=2883101 RepID=A0ABT2K151_9ACTN|nr:methylated-DNA--[protein]-cysteine S-methyltransferase [Streptomyces gossypii]MCT2593892.1 methylated-DNA--[protein]-cysteine S-methyltransferase [Streptomyces gossypii]